MNLPEFCKLNNVPRTSLRRYMNNKGLQKVGKQDLINEEVLGLLMEKIDELDYR